MPGASFLAGQIVTAQDLNESYPIGILADLSSSGSSGAMSSIGTVVTLPSTSYTITNSTSVTRAYKVRVAVRANMAAGASGLYRPLILDATPASFAGGAEQIMCTVTGASGAVGGATEATFTLAPAGTQTVQAGGIRVAGGSATDTFQQGRLIVTDLGPA
jgi:hypothetical protein